MAKPKNLILPDDIGIDKFKEFDISSDSPFIDMENDLFSKDHFGYYIMYISKHTNTICSSRLYLSFSHESEYRNATREKEEDKRVGNTLKQTQTHLFDIFKDQKELLWEAIQVIVTSRLAYSSLLDTLIGLKILIENLNALDIGISSILDFDNSMQAMVNKNFNPKHRKEELRLAGTIHKLGNNIANFGAITRIPIHQANHIEALPTNIAFQLDYYAKQEMLEIITKVNQIKEWRLDTSKNDIFAKNNLAKTYLDLQENYTLFNTFSIQIEKLGKTLYDINFREMRKTNNSLLIETSKNGINIELTSKQMFLAWHDKMYPDFPYSSSPLPQYKSLFTSRQTFIVKYKKAFNENIKELYSYMFPNIHTIYPLILFLLLREGLNSETLQSWQISKSKNGKYLLGETSPLATIIEGKKSRSNTRLKTTIKSDSDQKKFIDFYLDWLQPLYEKSNKNNFFQYFTIAYKINEFGKKYFYSYLSGKESLYYKYNICSNDGTRIYKINHQRIRPYSNYADYMRGYKEFERQFRKGHKHIDTQIAYENSTEWKGEKDYKIAKTQDFVVEIFRDNADDSNHHTAKLFQGLLADCKNPHNPTYEGHPKNFKENEACGSWFKCLTQCDKSVVIPKIHGPNIFAWLEYIEQERKKAIRISDWEKEYLADKRSALAVIHGFTDEEKEFSENNMHKSSWIMGKKLNSKFKIQEA